MSARPYQMLRATASVEHSATAFVSNFQRAKKGEEFAHAGWWS
jgi:hypothetical protein